MQNIATRVWLYSLAYKTLHLVLNFKEKQLTIKSHKVIVVALCQFETGCQVPNTSFSLFH